MTDETKLLELAMNHSGGVVIGAYRSNDDKFNSYISGYRDGEAAAREEIREKIRGLQSIEGLSHSALLILSALNTPSNKETL